MNSSGPQAFRWTASNGMVGMGYLPGGDESRAEAVSADGSVVVGYSIVSGDLHAFRWTQAAGLTDLGKGMPMGISADGLTIVGMDFSGVIVRWTQATGMVGLRNLPGGDGGFATAVSADGSVIVGSAQNSAGHSEAFRWTQAGGMVGLGTTPGGPPATWAWAI